MPDYDELLERKLEALEKGLPMERVLADIPEEALDLKPLLMLASAIRALPHPQPVTVLARQSLESIAAREKTRPIARPRILSPKPRILSPQPRILWPFGRTGLAVGFAAATLVVLLTFMAFFSLGSQRARAASLMEVSGVVRVASGSVEGKWEPAEDGVRVRAGQRIITGPNSSLTLVFADGSRMTLGPYTYVTLDELGGGWGTSLRLVATQHAGTTQNSVVPLRGAKSAYNLVTPAGVVSVHGTQFSVAVGLEGASRFAVDRGEVVVSEQGSALSLVSGQAAAAKPGVLPGVADYQFSLQGVVSGVGEGTWIVNGVSFIVTADTLRIGDIQDGMMVSVEGRVTELGERVADSVTSLGEPEGEGESTFTGVLEKINEDGTWVVDGVTIDVGEGTELGAGIALGKTVKVKFVVGEDGSWDALEVEALDDEEEPEATEAPGETEPITPTETVTPTTFVNCTGANPQPKAAKLAKEHGVSYEEIMGWFCDYHFGFGEIDRMYTLSETQGVSLTTLFDMRLSGLGWGQIKKQWPNWPISTTGEISPTLLPTTTLLPSSTLVTTTTLTITETEVLSNTLPKNDRSCPRSSDIPKAQSLAAKYGVSPELVGGLFCKGFGFGEIDKALSLSNGDLAIAQNILNMRSSGLGWGEIEALLKDSATTVAPGNKNKPKPSGGGQSNKPIKTPPGHGPKLPKPGKP
jgi:hypothetical protein